MYLSSNGCSLPGVPCVDAERLHTMEDKVRVRKETAAPKTHPSSSYFYEWRITMGVLLNLFTFLAKEAPVLVLEDATERSFEQNKPIAAF